MLPESAALKKKREPAPRAAAAARRDIPAPVLLALSIAAAVVLYLPALGTAFFADDFLFLDQVRMKPLLAALRTPDPLSNFYRPVSRQLYFWTIARASHESPWAFHVVGLVCFAVLLALLFGLTRRLAGVYAATFATALVALHYTGDVPVRWACGSQELLSVGFALATVWLFVSGRTWLAAITMALAALSKEVVLLTPLIAMVAGRREREPWRDAARRAWPLGLGVLVWALVWLLAPHTRQAAGTEVEIDPWGPLATYVHLVQVALGIETRKGDLLHALPRVLPPLVPLALALGAVLLAALGDRWRGVASRGRSGAPPSGSDLERTRRHAIVTGIAWALLATLPVVAVAILWSAYYYLFAMCGVAIALGAWLARRPPAWALAALALLAWGSNSARQIDEFATPRSPWTAMSHINRFYIERATRVCRRYLEDLKHFEPTLPPSSTLFFAGIKGNVAFQVANGPLMRWAYRDSSIRSYYLYQFSRSVAERGPLFVFLGAGDSLRPMTDSQDLFRRLALAMMLGDTPKGARDALELQLEHHPEDRDAARWLGWCEWAVGDTAAARQALTRAGDALVHAPAPELETAMGLARGGQVVAALAMVRPAAVQHALDPATHALLADLLLVTNPEDPEAPAEAFAARALAPQDPLVWRRWGSVQIHRHRYLEALKSLERYFTLAGAAGQGDAEAQGWVDQIRRAIPGGDLPAEGLRE